MKKSLIGLLVLSLWACASPGAPSDPQLSIVARDAEYWSVPTATIAGLSFSAVIQNDFHQPAMLGCGISLERNTGAGFQVVTPGACLGGGLSTDLDTVAPESERVYQLTTNLPLGAVDESASYRVVMSFFFGPTYKTGFVFYSAPFTITKRN